MDINYVRCVRTGFNPAHIQLSCDGTYIALPLTKTTVGIWSLQDIACKPLELEGHRKILTCLCLGNRASPKYFCSAAGDYIIVWDVQKARNALSKGNKVRGQIIATTMGYIQYCSFSPDDSLVAACCNNDVIILKSNTQMTVATLEGHINRVTCAEFCPHYTSTLVSVSEDRTFKVWNLTDFSLVYQSTIITASPFISMAMNLMVPQVAIGTADGQVRVFDLTDGNDFRCLHHIDVDKLIQKQREKKKQDILTPKSGPVVISSKPSWQTSATALDEEIEIDDQDVVETGCAILGLYFTFLPQTKSKKDNLPPVPAFFQQNDNLVSELLDAPPMLVVGTTGSLLQINAKTLEVEKTFDLQQDSLPSGSGDDIQTGNKVIHSAGSAYFCQGGNMQQLHCVIGSHFQNLVHILKWTHASQGKNPPDEASVNWNQLNLEESAPNSQRDNSESEIRGLSNAPLIQDSILLSELVMKTKEEPKSNKQKGFLTPKNKKPGQRVEDQPVTFNAKVKSSGYTESPRRTMFKPKTDFSKMTTAAKKIGIPSSSPSPLSKALSKQYPLSALPPSSFALSVDVAERPTPINCIKISGDGQYVACGLANRSALAFNLPNMNKSISYVGHNHNVCDASWSHSCNWLLTASDDKTASVWSKDQSGDPVMTFTTVSHNMVAKEQQNKDMENCVFPKEVKFARFYYMDKFILLTCGNNLYMYKYYLDPVKQDIKRYLSRSKYKKVTMFSLEAQHITAMSAINSFYSYIVMCAGSSKSIAIYDMNVGKCVRTMSDVHTRTVHTICQNQGSKYAAHPPDAYDLFVTAAAGDCIKMWDLRANRCVRRYEGHTNRTYPCGLDISPCGRFLASGSEDKSSYIFDIRGGTYIHKLTGHTDVVSDVAFHPLHSQMLTASLSGKLRFYTETQEN